MENLIEFITEKCVDVVTPLSITQLATDFKIRFGISILLETIRARVKGYCREIQKIEFVDTHTKVQQLFGLSAKVNSDYLEKLRKNAQVEVDDKNRITYYKAINGSLELRGDHHLSAKIRTGILESKGSLRSLIINYFETKNDADAIPKNKEERVIGNLIELITEKCENVNSPLNICQLTKDLKNRFGISILLDTIRARVKGYCREIQKVEFLDTQTKVQQLFGLSATVDSDCLKELRKNAQVEVDEKNRISYYKATNGSLELRGDHSLSAKCRTAKLESKGSIRSLINSYFENKNYADAVPNNKEEKEMWNLIEFITEKCENVISPLSILQLTKDFNDRFGTLIPSITFWKRIKSYCREIQREEFLNTHTKVRQLFCLSATLDSDCLKELRKDAVVEVDDQNRITKYSANDGSLTLHGDHGRSAKRKLAWIECKKKNTVKTHCSSGGDESEESEKEDGYSEDDSDEYSSEEFGSEFDSDDERDSLDEPDHVDSSNDVLDFDNETPTRNRTPTDMSTAENFDFDPPTERSHRSEEIERGADKGNDPDITGNESVKTRSGRLPKRRDLDSEVLYKQANSISSEVPKITDSLPTKSAIQKKQAPRSLNQSRSSSRSMRRSTRNSSFRSILTESEKNMDNQDAPGAAEFDNESSMRNGSPAEVSMADNYDFDPPTERTHRSEVTERTEDEEIDPKITANPSAKTRSGRLSKRRHLNSALSYSLANSLTTAAPKSTDSSSSKPAKQKKIAIEREQASSSSNQSTSSSRQIIRSIGISPSPSISTVSAERMGNQDAPDADGNPSDYHGPRIEAMDDYDYNPREDNLEIPPIDNHLEEPKPPANEEHNTNKDVLQTDKRSDAVAPEPKPEKECLTLQNNQNSAPQMNGNEFISIESHIRLLDSLLPMMKTFETPTLDEDQLRIEKTIEKFKEIGNEEDKIRLNEIRTSLMTCLLIVERSAKKEIVKREDTTSLEKFLIVFQNFLFSLKLKELDGFVARVKYMMNELEDNDKKFPTKKIQFAFKSIIETIVP
ncbi:unnamed protein product [Caenorhabditis brenneri]